MCETRWTHKYRSIWVFAEHFVDIVNQLENLAETGNSNTEQLAHQLLCAARTPTFIICLVIIKKYSSKLEPITQTLQTMELNLLSAQSTIQEILIAFHSDRGEQLNVANPLYETTEEHFRITMYIPYLDLSLHLLTLAMPKKINQHLVF